MGRLPLKLALTEALRTRRTAKQLTQIDLAKRLGDPATRYSGPHRTTSPPGALE